MNENDVLKDLCGKEITYGLYEPVLGDISIYSLIRHRVRYKFIEKCGFPAMKLQSKLVYFAAIKSFFLSSFQLMRLWIFRKTYSTVFYAFPRVDKIGGVYIDKFTDPLIDACDLKQDYLILDHGRAGIHPKPRAHFEKIVYTDLLEVFSFVYASLKYKVFYNKYRKEFDQLHLSIVKGMGIDYRKDEMVKHFFMTYVYALQLKALFRHISAKRVLGPARALMYGSFYAAHCLGMDSFELQHGVTYGESVLYSGYRDPMIMPDYFLAFGDNKPSSVYGIDESRIVNIGWAFQDYLAKLPHKESYKEKDVLVISDPEVTDAIIEVVLKLAEDNPESTFYIRPHPHEIISEQHLISISSKSNIRIQDKSINISVVLQGFNHVVGENSTVLYEALAVNKKVGRLYYRGLNPKYLEESDRECSWEIYNQEDFERFLSEDITLKKSKSIYSKFNKELFCKTVGIEL